MKKKVLYKVLPLMAVIVLLISTLAFYLITLNRGNNLNIIEPNLRATAQVKGNIGCKMAFDKSPVTFWNISSANQEAEVMFDQEKEVNALLLNEIGHNVKKFSVYYFKDNQWELCYQQNEIGLNRLATFYPVKTKGIKIVVDEFKNMARISDIKIYSLEPRERKSELRVTSYITPGSFNDYDQQTGTSETIDRACFDTVTDVQFIAYGRFDENGGVNKEKDADNLVYLKEMIGDRDVNVFITIFPPTQTDMASLLRNNMENTINSAVQMVLDADVQGVDFDWEYPANAEQYDLYSQFLIKLKKELVMHGKMLSVALSPWGIQLNQEAIDSIDQLQLMAYDLFDHNGDNNSYAGSTESAISYMLSKGFKPEQLNLGISYYGRPSDASGKWVDFKDKNFTQNEYIMIENDIYFNTPTTVRDKTAYSVLRGIGGIMTFSQNEDLPISDPLSLTAQIGKAKNAFSWEVEHEKVK